MEWVGRSLASAVKPCQVSWGEPESFACWRGAWATVAASSQLVQLMPLFTCRACRLFHASSPLLPAQVMLPLFCATRAATVVLALAEVAATKLNGQLSAVLAGGLGGGRRQRGGERTGLLLRLPQRLVELATSPETVRRFASRTHTLFAHCLQEA